MLRGPVLAAVIAGVPGESIDSHLRRYCGRSGGDPGKNSEQILHLAKVMKLNVAFSDVFLSDGFVQEPQASPRRRVTAWPLAVARCALKSRI